MSRYDLEFVLSAYNLSLDIIRNNLEHFGEGLEVVELTKEAPGSYNDFKVSISTHDPTLIFDSCSAIGRIKSVKIDEKKGPGE